MKRSRLARWALWLWASPNTLIGLVLGLLLIPAGARFSRDWDNPFEVEARRVGGC